MNKISDSCCFAPLHSCSQREQVLTAVLSGTTKREFPCHFWKFFCKSMRWRFKFALLGGLISVPEWGPGQWNGSLHIANCKKRGAHSALSPQMSSPQILLADLCSFQEQQATWIAAAHTKNAGDSDDKPVHTHLLMLASQSHDKC